MKTYIQAIIAKSNTFNSILVCPDLILDQDILDEITIERGEEWDWVEDVDGDVDVFGFLQEDPNSNIPYDSNLRWRLRCKGVRND